MAPVNRNKPVRAASSESTYTVMDLERDFPDDATCLAWLWRKHFSEDGEHALCPKCDRERKFHRVASRPSYSCDSCGQHLHPTAGTIFHKSSTSLALWFKAVFLMSSTRCGISAKQLEREIGCTYKTAWRMFHLIRNQLMEQDGTPLDGDVEADETFYGGKMRNADRRKTQAAKMARYTPVAGVVQRGGRVIASVTKHRVDVRDHVYSYVLPSANLITDDWRPYLPTGEKFASHQTVNHTERIYVSGDVHTQTIEGFWALVKNGIRGTYHAVSRKHLQGYLNEYAWRYNHRDDVEPMFLSLLDNIAPLS